MPDLTVWPTDGADGSVSSEARWRKMARYWAPSGVADGQGAEMVPTLVAGPAVRVDVGACFLDGHYAELTAPATLSAPGDGIVVVRFTPADNHAEILFRAGVLVPTQTDASWELPIAVMSAGALFDRRALLRADSHAASAVADTTITTVAPTLTSIASAFLSVPNPGSYRVVCTFDVDVTAVAAGNIIFCYLAPTGAITVAPGTGQLRVGLDMNTVRRHVGLQFVADVRIGLGPPVLQMSAAKQAATGTAIIRANLQATFITATRIG